MIRFVVRVATIEQLEILLGVAKTLDLTPDLGSEAPPSPRRVAKRSSKKQKLKGKGSKPKRYSKNMEIRLGKAVDGPPKLRQVQGYLREDFGSRVFKKGLAKGALLKHDVYNPTGYVTKLMDTGGLVPA